MATSVGLSLYVSLAASHPSTFFRLSWVNFTSDKLGTAGKTEGSTKKSIEEIGGIDDAFQRSNVAGRVGRAYDGGL